MKVLVDTSVWSLALRRRAGPEHEAASALKALVIQGRVAIIGPIRQELLSGIREQSHYETLRDHLRAFHDEALQTEDFEQAAAYFNDCRVRGIQGSNTDFLICAVAERRGFPILTTDADFLGFAGILPIALYGRDHP